MTPWEIHGTEFGNCNCDYACPCQFNSLPNHGFCEAAVGYQVERGHYGDVKLDGLRMAGMYQWPGAVHEGNGTMQLIIDEDASEAQRAALIAIMNGKDTEDVPFANFSRQLMRKADAVKKRSSCDAVRLRLTIEEGRLSRRARSRRPR